MTTPIGYLPRPDGLDTSGLAVSAAGLEALLTVDVARWKAEAEDIAVNYAKLGDRLPDALLDQLDQLRARLENA